MKHRLPLKYVIAALSTFALQSLVMPASAQDAPPPADMAWQHGGHHGGMDAIIAKLSTDGQVVFKQFLADMKAEREKNHAPMQSARIKIMIAMRAQPFNADALRSAFAEERALADAAHKQHQESEVAGLTKLSATDRTIVVEAIAKMHDAMEMRHAQHRLMKKAG